MLANRPDGIFTSLLRLNARYVSDVKLENSADESDVIRLLYRSLRECHTHVYDTKDCLQDLKLRLACECPGLHGRDRVV